MLTDGGRDVTLQRQRKKRDDDASNATGTRTQQVGGPGAQGRL